MAAIIPDKKAAKNSNANQTAGGQSDNPFAFLSNLPGMRQIFPSQPQTPLYEENAEADKTANELELAREQVRQQLRQGLLEDQMIDIDVIDNKANTIDIGGNENMSISIGSIFGDMVPQKMKKKKLKVKDARKILREQEAQNLWIWTRLPQRRWKTRSRTVSFLSTKSTRLPTVPNTAAGREFPERVCRGTSSLY